jgi:hypothetical protein
MSIWYASCRFALLAYFGSVLGRRLVTMLVCIGLLAWLVFRKSEPRTLGLYSKLGA